ncbi:hypothetical protein BT69DRAFT_1268502 [Atractiella rhizophila]|nr:hypothetical protein BT69DRAFT_1268502 [Atractiella rhizophila]
MAQSSTIVNWHWRNKDCTKWSQEWFKNELLLSEGPVRIESVGEIEGLCELGMRKAKVVTIYDFKITMRWEADLSDGEKASGDITALEVMHDLDESDYTFEYTCNSSKKEAKDLFENNVKKTLSKALRAKFHEYPKVLMETHGNQMIVDPNSISQPPSGAQTPAGTAPSPGPSASPAPSGSAGVKPSTKTESAALNTSTVKVDGAFMVTAEDLWSFLTDETKVPMWTRNPAKIKPEPGAEISMFGNNIVGKVISVDAPKKMVSTWRAPTWPEGHFGELTTILSQGSDSTTLTLRLSKVPVGKEDEAERNLDAFYIKSLKQIGSVMAVQPFPPTQQQTTLPPPKFGKLGLVAAGAVPFLISVSLIVGLIAAFLYGPSGPLKR